MHEEINGNSKEIIRYPNCHVGNLLYMFCYPVCTVNGRKLGKD